MSKAKPSRPELAYLGDFQHEEKFLLEYARDKFDHDYSIRSDYYYPDEFIIPDTPLGEVYLDYLQTECSAGAYGSHAEDSAIQAFKKKYSTDPTGGVMWCTLSACSHCTKTLEKYKIRSRYLYKYTGAL